MRTILICLSLGTSLALGQTNAQTDHPYRVRRATELTGSVLFVGASYIGFKQLDRVATFTATDIARLDPRQINAFDRPAAFANPAFFEQAQRRSDLLLNLSIASPLLLLADRRIRHDALDLLTLYATSHAVNNLVYFGAAYSIRRARPLTYNPALPVSEKVGVAKSNSFYSGHVSFSSTSTFFAAKVLTDYHQIRGWKRVGIFSLASVPPLLVGVNRMKAGKHFRTDVLTGFIIGAACGIGVPQLHRVHRTPESLRLQPYFMTSGESGLTLTYHL